MGTHDFCTTNCSDCFEKVLNSRHWSSIAGSWLNSKSLLVLLYVSKHLEYLCSSRILHIPDSPPSALYRAPRKLAFSRSAANRAINPSIPPMHGSTGLLELVPMTSLEFLTDPLRRTQGPVKGRLLALTFRVVVELILIVVLVVVDRLIASSKASIRPCAASEHSRARSSSR